MVSAVVDIVTQFVSANLEHAIQVGAQWWSHNFGWMFVRIFIIFVLDMNGKKNCA